MFEDKLLKVYRYCRFCLIICVVVFTIAGFCFGVAANMGIRGTCGMIASAVIILLAGQCMVTVKLWYWIMNNKLNVLKEIKQLQLQIAELTVQPPTSED